MLHDLEMERRIAHVRDSEDEDEKTIPWAGTFISRAEADRISKDGP
jgi:hypothetical protein